MNQNKKKEKPAQLGRTRGPKLGSSLDQPNGQQQPSPVILSLSLSLSCCQVGPTCRLFLPRHHLPLSLWFLEMAGVTPPLTPCA
jgi:hypothetical protein